MGFREMTLTVSFLLDWAILGHGWTSARVCHQGMGPFVVCQVLEEKLETRKGMGRDMYGPFKRAIREQGGRTGAGRTLGLISNP